MERYYLYKSSEGPEEQIGICLKVNSNNNLSDFTEILSFNERANNSYCANHNVNIWGIPRGEKDLVCLRVLKDSQIEIITHPTNPIYLKEISKEEALQIKKTIDFYRENHPKQPSFK